MRPSGRQPDQLRPVTLTRKFTRHAEGSVLVCFGDTQVLCTASVLPKVPPHKKGSGEGWVTAEYGMLPRAGAERTPRSRQMASGRTHEIQRLIGRSLRAVVDLDALSERTIMLDCDVLQADGGTRTAAITGAYVCLAEALRRLQADGVFAKVPIFDAVAAVSVGLVSGELVLDLCYTEDSMAAVDMNVVMTGAGKLVEVQGTAEGMPFTRERMDEMLDLAAAGIKQLLSAQKDALEETKL